MGPADRMLYKISLVRNQLSDVQTDGPRWLWAGAFFYPRPRKTSDRVLGRVDPGRGFSASPDVEATGVAEPVAVLQGPTPAFQGQQRGHERRNGPRVLTHHPLVVLRHPRRALLRRRPALAVRQRGGRRRPGQLLAAIVDEHLILTLGPVRGGEPLDHRIHPSFAVQREAHDPDPLLTLVGGRLVVEAGPGVELVLPTVRRGEHHDDV